MDNSKGQTIFLSVIGIATLLVAIIGATFAWFSVSVTGNDEASNIIINTAVLGEVEFEDTSAITLTDIRPQTEATTKTFYVRNPEDEATETIAYNIYLDVTENDLTAVAEGYFKHSLTGEGGTGTKVTVAEGTVVPEVGSHLLGSGTLVGKDEHKYTYSIIFEESGSDQNAAQGKKFAGKLRVELVDQTSSTN